MGARVAERSRASSKINYLDLKVECSNLAFFLFFLPSSGISTCVWTDLGVVLPMTLGAALLCSSWAGSDMWLDPEFDHPLHSSPWWGDNYRCVDSFYRRIHMTCPCVKRCISPKIILGGHELKDVQERWRSADLRSHRKEELCSSSIKK